MTDVWLTIGLLTVGTVTIKAAGPVILGGRDLPPRLNGVVARLAPALLAALVVVDTFGRDKALGIDESAAGLAAAAVALAARAPMFVVVVIAAAATALLRAVT
jgi:branched-subunit amino acid transport protein